MQENHSQKSSIGPGYYSTEVRKTAHEQMNLQFYQNAIKSQPAPHGFIDDIQYNWYGKYDLLETHHGYIQWLFPIFESAGMSEESFVLGKLESRMMKGDVSVSVRIIKSYIMMLDFYGMMLTDYATGNIEINPNNYKERFRNLNEEPHNYLRISRILQSLGQLGFARYKQPWMDFVAKQLQSHKLLSNCEKSFKTFWIPLCDPSTPGYAEKTKEVPEDGYESIFFDVINDGDSDEWKNIKMELDLYPSPLKASPV